MSIRNRSAPTIRFTLSQHRIHISKAVLYAIGFPTHIQIIITSDNKTLYIKKCLERVVDRFAVPSNIFYSNGAMVFGLQKTAFAEAVMKRLNRSKKEIYRIHGTVVAEGVMAFLFEDAERLDGAINGQ